MTIFIYPNLEKLHSKECTAEVIEILKSLGVTVLMTPDTNRVFGGKCEEESTINRAVSQCDIVITIGGDGTILKIASTAAKHKKKLLGINCGRLGFMASLERSELDCLKNLCSGHYETEHRMMLDVMVKSEKRGEATIKTVLNDVVITHDFKESLNDFTVLADGIVVSHLRADGIIFSTPTGASAYALSAGGPLIEPSMDCIEFTHICPHSLSARAMIFDPNKIIEVRTKATGKITLRADGGKAISITSDDSIYIRRSNLSLSVIDIHGDNYFKSISTKLMNNAKEVDEEAQDK
ncbi:MAG: NAD(+)/NADH kinase [Oscillospiraceae bacterium]|nr:NAD(+)/NADH kinase [Oscillospiraceae bacterium]